MKQSIRFVLEVVEIIYQKVLLLMVDITMLTTVANWTRTRCLKW